MELAKPRINIKQYFDFQIARNKGAIKSLRMLAPTTTINHKIKKLKATNKLLKKEYLKQKKQSLQISKSSILEIKKIIKVWRKLLFAQKHIASRKTFDFLKQEHENLKINKKALVHSKYQKIYGTSEGKLLQHKLDFGVRLLVIFLFLVAFIIPFWIVISVSTKTNVEMGEITKFGSFIPSQNSLGAEENYALAIKSLDIWNSIFVTLGITIISNILILFFASMATWQLVRNDKWYSKLLFYIFIAAMILPFQSIMLPLVFQMQRLELRNTIIGIIISYIGFGLALSIFMLHGFLKTIPRALEESAAMSGMGPFKIFTRIVLPLLRNTFITILVLNIMWIWNDYLLPSLMLNDQYGYQTLQVRLIDTLVNETSQNLQVISAGIVILIIPPIVYFTMSQKQMISGITKGSIK